MATTSPKYKLDAWDFLKSLAVASLSQPALVILTSLSAGYFNINWTETWHLAVASAAGYLIKNYFSGPKPPTPNNFKGPLGAGGKVIPVVFCLLVASSSFGQSIFKPLPLIPKPQPERRPSINRAIVGPTDSLPNISNGHFRGFRFSGPDLAFAVPDFSIYTGLGIDYVTATADQATGKWTYDFTIGARVYGGADLGTPTVRTIGAVGIRATFLKGWLALAAIYNLTTKKPQAAIGNPAALIPGLN